MRTVGIDTETHLIAPGCMAPRLVCVSLAEREDGAEIKGALYDRVAGLAQVRRLLTDPGVHLVAHNVFFDLAVFAAEDDSLLPMIFAAIDAGRIHCTKIRQMIIDNAEGKLKFVFNEETGEYDKQNYYLATLVRRYFGLDIEASKHGPDAWRMRYNELDGVPIEAWPEAASAYAISDAIQHLGVYLAQESYCEPRGLPGGADGERWQTRAGWALYLAGAWGVRTDGQAVAKLRAEVEEEYAKHVAEAQRWGFIRKGKKESRDTKKIAAAVQSWYVERKKTYKWTTGGKTGQAKVATDREQLTDVECPCGLPFRGCSCGNKPETDGVHRGLWAVAEVVRLSKLLSTYVRALERGVKVPLNPSYNAIIETYRTSCSQGMKIDGVPVGFNAQNPPRKDGVRECIVPRGFYRTTPSVFAFCDYDTLEMRTLAQTCIELFGYSHIADAIRDKKDLHLMIAATLMGIEYEQAVLLYAQEDKNTNDNRQVAKPANYGMAGGMAPKTFVAYAKGMGITVTLPLAKQLHRAFRTTWKEMNDYFAHIESLMGDGGKAKTIVFPKSGLMRGDVNYTAAANGFFQHRAAMGAKEAMYVVSRECYVDQASPLYGCRPWLFAHDEIGIEIPYAGRRASAAALRLQQVMIDEMSKWCPDVPIGATACMTRRWRKGAKAVFVDAQGKVCKPDAPGAYMVPSKPEGKQWVPDLEEERMAA